MRRSEITEARRRHGETAEREGLDAILERQDVDVDEESDPLSVSATREV